jgi:hypothetical protein
MKPELVRAIALVKRGKSFSEAADAIGITRGAVAGACNRAGVKAEWTERKRNKIAAANSATMLRYWTKKNRKRHGKIMKRWHADNEKKSAEIGAKMRAARWRERSQ